MPKSQSKAEKIYSGLLVAGIGDALGAPTEQYTMDEIKTHFGEGLISEFYAPPRDTFAGANDGKIAEVTDDASQMYYLARALSSKGKAFNNDDWIECLVSWRDTSPKAGFMGPSTEALINALKNGDDPTRFGLIGDSERKMTNIGATNGAAMRCAPIGMCFPGDVKTTAEYTLQTCLPSHDASIAIEAACAIAGGTAIAMQADTWQEVIQGCRQGAVIGRELAAKHARLEAGPRFQARMERALEIAKQSSNDWAFMAWLEAEVGNSVLAAESVPCAVAIMAYAKGDSWRAIQLSATIGNDSDSIAAMVGAMAGVLNGHDSVPTHLVESFIKANPDFDLQNLTDGLVKFSS